MKKVVEWSEIRSLFQGSMMSYLTGIYIFAHYLELSDRWPVLQTIRFHFTFGALLFGLSIMKISRTKTKIKTSSALVNTTLAFIFVLGFYSVFSMDQSQSLNVFIDRVVKFAMLSMFIYASVEKAEDLRVIIVFLLLAWFKIASEGVVGWFTGSLMWYNQGIPRLHGSTSDTGHPNSFSGFAVGCLPFCVYLLGGVRHYLAKLALLALLASALIVVVNTGSRTGYVAVVVGAALYFITMKSSKTKMLLLGLVVIIGTLQFVPEHYKERFESIYSGKEKEGHSSERRKEIMADALEIFIHYPLGVGVHAFPKVRSDMFGRRQDTHNLYLEVLTNIGIIGFFFFVAFIRKLMGLNLQAIRTLSKATEPKCDADLNTLFLLAISKAVFGFLIMRLLLGLFGMDLYEIYWWLALGLILSVNKLMVTDVCRNKT